MLALDRMVVAVTALLALMPAVGRAQTFEFYVSIEGTKQGLFANESIRSNHMPRVVGLNFDYLVKTPLDPATGAVSGKRRHGPVVMTKEWGAASPQLFQALVSNELLKSVVFEFYQTNQQGEEEVATLVKLTNAAVVEIHQHSPPVGNNRRQLEDVSFTFGAIEIQHLPGKTIATDSWTGLR
ncbi:MAG: type VI secretion system tube protein Hcp [Gemmatimonadaceae bacterium]|nr:type VI secretion system tube protein Hcp [Gloeobacterales cyanobacterium ES-bin-141]